MPAAVAYIGAAWGGLAGAVLIMNSVAIGNFLWAAVAPAIGPALRRSAARSSGARG